MNPQDQGTEREVLFPEEAVDSVYQDESREIATTMDVTNKIYAIRLLEKQQAMFELQDQESRAFYSRKKAACDERMEYLKRQILNYLQSRNQKNIQTPAGTAYQRLLTTRHWPSDDLLLSWCLKCLPDAVKVSQDVDKRIISEHIKGRGEIPEGYLESHQVRLYLK
jgi:hypothetical protein